MTHEWSDPSCGYDILAMDSNGDNVSNITCIDGHSWNSGPSWSPDGTKIVFGRTICCPAPPEKLHTMNPDGSDRMTLADLTGSSPAWSPDGSKIVYNFFEGSSVRIKVVDKDGTNVVDLTDGGNPDWQPIPINSYPRPKGATLTKVAMVPAYTQCTSPTARTDRRLPSRRAAHPHRPPTN